MSVEQAIQAVIRVVDERCDPERMTRAEYKEFLGCLISDLEIRDEARRQEDGEKP